MASDEQANPALKEIFNRQRFRHIAAETAAISPAFDTERFLSLAMAGLAEFGIMQRMRQGAEAMRAALPLPYAESLDVLEQLAPRIGTASPRSCCRNMWHCSGARISTGRWRR